MRIKGQSPGKAPGAGSKNLNHIIANREHQSVQLSVVRKYVTRTILQHYTVNPPSTEDHWYGPWTSILTTLFPTSQGYIVTPQRRIPEDSESHILDFVIEVVRLISSPIQFRTVLIVEVKNSQHWEAGIPSLERQIKRQTDATFSGTAVSQVYWIGVIGVMVSKKMTGWTLDR